MTDILHKDCHYILKMIVLADMDIALYKYFMKNPETLTSVEKGNEIPEKHREETTESVKELLVNPPHSDEIKTDLAEIFYLVGLFEEPSPNPRKIINLSKSDPRKAIGFVKDMPGNWMHFSKNILGSLSQSFEVIKGEPAKGDDPAFIEPVKKEVETIKMFILEFAKKGIKEHKSLIKSFLMMLPSLGPSSVKVLNNNELEILNLSLDSGTEEFWQQYLAIERFKDFNNFSQVTSNLDNQKIAESEVIAPLLSKLLTFLDSNLEDVIRLVKSKKLFETKKSKEFQKQIVQYFTNQGDPARRDLLFDLFKEVKLSDENKMTIIDDVTEKNEYQRIKNLLAIDLFNEIIISQKLGNLKNFLTNQADFNSVDCKELVETILKPDKFVKYQLLDSEFLKKLGHKIKDVGDQNLREEFIGLLINNKNKLIPVIKKNKKGYLSLLDIVYKSAISNTKRKITNFKKIIDEGKKNGRRRKPKAIRKSTT